MKKMAAAMKIKLFDTTLPAPRYHTKGSAGLDLYARETVVIKPGEVVVVSLNVAVELPAGYWGMLSARSSLHKKGLMMANGIGVMDPDYAGDTDEYRAALYNHSTQPATVERGERIVQLVVLPVLQANLIQVTKLSGPERGGFGSTGAHELPAE